MPKKPTLAERIHEMCFFERHDEHCTWRGHDIANEVAEMEGRQKAVLACPGPMCGHCISILLGDEPPTTTPAEKESADA